MSRAKKTRKFAQMKRVISKRDDRLKKNQILNQAKQQKPKEDEVTRHIPQVSSALFFQANTALKPPYDILMDTNSFALAVHYKIDILEAMMNCLYAECRPIITDCVMAELEKLPQPKYRIALRLARDERFGRLTCGHKGVYADDCLVDRVMKHKIYIVATNDRDLKRRIRKVPGVPIMSVGKGKYVVERLPDAPEK